MRFVVNEEQSGSRSLTPCDSISENWLLKQKGGGKVELQYMTKAKTRSLAQNRLAWIWYGGIEEEMGEEAGWGHSFCKLTIGVPILRRDSESFRAFYDKVVKPLPYAEKLIGIENVDITSRLNTAQMTEYLETIQRKFAEQGIALDSEGYL